MSIQFPCSPVIKHHPADTARPCDHQMSRSYSCCPFVSSANCKPLGVTSSSFPFVNKILKRPSGKTPRLLQSEHTRGDSSLSWLSESDRQLLGTSNSTRSNVKPQAYRSLKERLQVKDDKQTLLCSVPGKIVFTESQSLCGLGGGDGSNSNRSIKVSLCPLLNRWLHHFN